MGPSLYNNYFNGPTVALPPPSQLNRHQPSQLAASDSTNHPFISSDGSHFPQSSSARPDCVQFGVPKSSTGPHASAFTFNVPTSIPSRKRSRDEFIQDTPFDTALVSQQAVSLPTLPPTQQPIYGEGMTIIDPKTGMAASASSQTGTWHEEKLEEEAASNPVSVPMDVSGASQPLPSRKTQRVEANASAYDDITALSNSRKLQATSDDVSGPASSTKGPQMPHVDDSTRMLGISWQRAVHQDKDMAAAVRGWEKYLNNHFSRHLNNSRIILKHRGLNVFLVSADPSPSACAEADPNDHRAPTRGPQRWFYLFEESLARGQLIGKDWPTSQKNLLTSPVSFYTGAEILKAEEKTPDRQVDDKGIPSAAVGMNQSSMGVVGASAESRMQMDID